jgi:hypothetical protein
MRTKRMLSLSLVAGLSITCDADPGDSVSGC